MIVPARRSRRIPSTTRIRSGSVRGTEAYDVAGEATTSDPELGSARVGGYRVVWVRAAVRPAVLGVPSPVAASQPVPAEHPVIPATELFRTVMWWNASAYSAGFS